ncbi:MAG TPA: hypothetical protein VEP90_11180 [Methylomirabilota bacterium]|nr:hypothetical protein [Methylomirabilota bacterium]
MKLKKLSNRLTFDPHKNVIMWKGYPIQYRLSLRLLPEYEYEVIAKYFNMTQEQLEKRFNLW